MAKSILPISRPLITHSPPVAYLLSILGTNTQTSSWIYNHYINFYIDHSRKDDNFLDRRKFHHGCPWTSNSHIPRYIIDKLPYLIDFIRECIMNGNYVYSIINMKYISAYRCVSNTDHNMLIYGFDDELETFNIADFFLNGIYSYGTCTYNELLLASDISMLGEEINDYKWELVKLNSIKYDFNLESLKMQLENHARSTNLFGQYDCQPGDSYITLNDLRNNYYFDLSYYDKLGEFYQTGAHVRTRAINLIHAYSVLMIRRLEYIQKEGILKTDKFADAAKELEHFAQLAQNMSIKHNLKPSVTTQSHMIEKVSIIKSIDQLLTNSILEAL